MDSDATVMKPETAGKKKPTRVWVAILLALGVGYYGGYAVADGKTPPSCIAALDLAAEGFAMVSEFTTAAGAGDFTAMDAATTDLATITNEAGTLSADCRASA